MKQQFFLVIGAAACVALSAAAACKVETTDGAGGSGAGTTTGTTTTTNEGGGTTGGGGTTATSTGGGGGGTCLSCAEYISDEAAEIEQVCGYTAEGCETGSSCEKLVAIGDCVCGPNQDGTGKCVDKCPVSCGVDPNGDDKDCQACALTECGTEAQACLNDAG